MCPDHGGKRKYKENAFTAKAESGTLRVKILRKDFRNGAVPAASSDSALSGFLTATSRSTQQQQTQQQQQQDQQPLSPPKPRPNRKHVPIFYQRQTVSTDAASSSTSSTDDAMSGMQSMSTTSVDYNTNDHSTSSTTAVATSQDGSRFSTLISGLRLENGNGNSENGFSRLSPPPASNPLFTRSDSDGTSTFGDILRHSFPSAQGPAPPPPQLGSFSSFHGLQGGPAASALHQLASSSSSFGSSLASLSSAARDLSSSPRSTEGYRFNPFTALQSAIDVHQAAIGGSTAPSTSFTNHQQTHAPYQYPHERQHAHHQHQQQTGAHRAQSYSQQTDAEGDDAMDDGDNDLGPPPSAPPAFVIQNSLMGGGIEMQPVIANVNTHNFDWSSGTTGRPRSGSLPNILEAGHTAQSNGSSGNASGASNSTTTASNVHMWKEV
ncbi:hypothetical protein FI667_g15505, partial [Globisporangium splendens]